MKKRIISLILVICMLFSMAPAGVLAAGDKGSGTAVQLDNPFADVKKSNWFYDAVQYVRVNSLFNGTTAETFDPNGTMTRGMFVTVLGRMAGVDPSDYAGQQVFDDVPATAYYAPYVAWAHKYGITTGVGDSWFGASDTINRAQMATFFVRYFEAFDVYYHTDTIVPNLPADLGEIPTWAKSAALKLWRQGLLNGDGSSFDPDSLASRAQAATLCMRTDEAVDVWYKAPGVTSDRVRIDPATGKPYEDESNDDPEGEKPEDKPTTPPSGGGGGGGGAVPPPASNKCSVSFYDGDRLIDTLQATKGEPLGAVPALEKSSKANAILLGYFTDKACTQPFYAEEPVNSSMKVYAKYEEMGDPETLTFTSFAQMDQKPNMTFEVVGSGNPAQAVTLEVMDGSAPVELGFVASAGGYIVSAPAGFNEGASYQLHLAEGWTFKDKPETIRTASFSIAMEEVENLEMSDGIYYIKDTEAISYIVGGVSHKVLVPNLITEAGGSFNYTADTMPQEGDIVCVYVGTHPEARTGGTDTLDPAVYVKVSAVNGSEISFTQLSAEDHQELYDIPDNFPIIVSALPTAATGSVNIASLDKDMYVTMMGEGYTLENVMGKALAAIEKGDFITLYVSQDSIKSEADLYYAEITGYNAESGVISYKQTTRQAILDSMDLYADIEISGDEYITDEEKREMEAALLSQVEASGFAEDAAFMLADMITKTDGFAESAGVQDLLITDANGNELSPEELQLLNLGTSFELSDDIKLTVELITKGDQLHFKGGVQLAIGIDAGFEVELEDEEKIAIDLSATFVQEVVLDPRVKGEIVYKEILWIPIPIGVKVGATIDIKNFTAFSFEAQVYTVAPEDTPLWKQFQDVMNNPEKLADIAGLPSELSEGLQTAGDVIDKIEELESELAKVKDTVEGTAAQIQGYLDDIELLWEAVDHVITEEDYSAACEALDQTNITSDLLNMMNLTNETGLETEYYDSMQALMDRYCEMLEQESDWVTLVEKEIYTYEYCYYGVVIGVEINFIVRADLSLAIGSNLQYEVGKRYEFWFKIGLFKPTAGSSTMDLIDEQFAFQFYVMGRLGLKAGIAAKLYVGIGTGDLASVGITTELGPYVKIYGFFVYEYTKYRAANTSNWNADERMAGALFLEFGLYFMLGFEAEALGLFEYSYDFLDKEFPLLEVGDRRYYYQPNYAPEEGEIVLVRDVDNNSTNGITMTLPTNLLALKYVDLTSGMMAVEALDYDKYIYTVSNPNFSVDSNTGEIKVSVPQGVRYMECDLTITYKYGKMAFSTFDMAVTVPLVWTNMATDDLAQYYTAAVRVGNDTDGYDTVWTKRVLKNKEFDLPTAAELKELIDWNDYKHVPGTGYGQQQTEGLTIIDDKVYDFNIDYKTYSITVNGVQSADGSTGSRTFYADYGEAFDFSALAETGKADYANKDFTRFSDLTTDAKITVTVKDANGNPVNEQRDFDLTKAIDSRMAAALSAGVTATANYIDDSVTATFTFTGIEAEDIKVKLRRGDTPDFSAVETLVSDLGMAIKDIYPALGVISASTTYQVVCGQLTGPEATVSFVENGGSAVADITKIVGSLIGALPTPEKSGHNFCGWYTDAECTTLFSGTKVPEGGITLYAKWEAVTMTLSFHVNGGNSWTGDEGSKTLAYGQAYGELPVPERSGHGFIGWFTAAEGGEEVTAETIVNTTEAHTLYAHWRQLKEIPASVFDFGAVETGAYSKGSDAKATYTFTAEEGESYVLGDFTLEYIAEGYESEGYLPGANQAGTWGVKITRPADNTYAKFEQFYPGVLVIQRATRNLYITAVNVVDSGYTYLDLNLDSPNAPQFGWIYDLHESAQIVYTLDKIEGELILPGYGGTATAESEGDTARVNGLIPGTTYVVTISVINDRNYNDNSIVTPVKAEDIVTKSIPTTSWATEGNYDTSWYNATATEFSIGTAAQLAGLAKLVNDETDTFTGKTIKLTADIDLSAHEWVPIGGENGYFAGVFDGQGHTVWGAVCDEASTSGVGLFGLVAAVAEPVYHTSTDIMTSFRLNAEPCVIRNLAVDDSYFYGYTNVGGIAGSVNVQFVGDHDNLGMGIVHDEILVQIDNCVSYATVRAAGNAEKGTANVGGIVGYMFHHQHRVMNCVNYGTVIANQSRAGGIVGYNGSATTLNDHKIHGGDIGNCVNFGTVTGTSNVGGIAGVCEGENAAVANSYNYGTVKASANGYVGAVVGRNVSDDGTAKYNYYLAGCATGADGITRGALGTSTGSVAPGDKGEKGYIASSFTSISSKMSYTAENAANLTLINALNLCSEANSLSLWEATGPNGYPLPVGSPISALRK